MIVDDLQKAMEGGRLVVSGRLTWEDNARKSSRIRFEFEPRLEADVECNPNAFLVAVAAPAAFYGERRIRIDGKVCPVLHDNILTVLTQLQQWFDKSRKFPVVEPTEGFEARKPLAPGRAGQFFSGGIDALTTLRRNRLLYPADHPRSIRDCINVFGMHLDDYNIEDEQPNPARVEMWDKNLVHLRKVTDAADVDLYQVRTNVLGIFDKVSFYCNEYHSAVMLSLAHLLARRLSDVFISASDFIGDFAPWGSHPLIDPYYSSSDVAIHHDGTRLNRLEKVRLISQWPAALSMINVCSSWTVPENGMNCGRCGKCVRTMTELLVCGKLAEAKTFPDDDVDPALFKGFTLRTNHDVIYFKECIDSLREMGRHDLLAAIDDRMADHARWQRRKSGRGLKQKIKKLDQHLLGGKLQKRWKELRGEDPTQSNRLVQRAVAAESKNKS